MRAPIIKYFDERLRNQTSISIRKILIENKYEESSAAIYWLLDLFKRKIKGRKKFPEFEKIIGKELKIVLNSGDGFYKLLFRKNGFINDNTKNKESLTPYSDTILHIYNSLFKSDHTHSALLTIYSELRKYFEQKFGEFIGKDLSFRTYEKWLLIDEELEMEYTIYDGWIKNIPAGIIATEKHKFCQVKRGTKLSDMASLRGFTRNNEAAAKNYLTELKALTKKSDFEYIQEATSGSDLLYFKQPLAFQSRLIYRSQASDLLSFADSLIYPNLQDHFLLNITELDEFTDLISLVLLSKNLKTPKPHLLLIVLESYYEFVDRTLFDLRGFTEDKLVHEKNDQTEQILREAKSEYDKWLNTLIPNSFNKILDQIFNRKNLSDSKFFLLLFEWLNSHSKLHLIHPGTESKKALIDLMNDLFQIRQNINETDRHYLIDSLQKVQINYEALKKLLNIFIEHKEDFVFRDKLYERYIYFINSAEFSWYAEGDINFEEAINNAYYFSQVLTSYPDSIERWNLLFQKFKTNHDGWMYSSADYKVYQRESFILTSGIGLAYFSYSEGDVESGDRIVFKVLENIINQLRNSSDSRTIDYTTPIKFAAITIGKFSRGKNDSFLGLLLKKIDNLKFILIAINELSANTKNFNISDTTKEEIKKRITDEFWIIETRRSEVELKNRLDYYNALKYEALKLCSISG